LLLDSAFAKPQFFPRLSKKANLAHAVHDCGLSPQAEDREIYQKAIETDRFVLTINFNDFRKLVKKGKPGIIAIPSELSNQEIDLLLCNFLSMKNPDDYTGLAVKAV
jgi:predicted nuclease of predicted toxin-antitoxin system